MHMGEAPGEGTAADIRVAVTTITDGTDGRILYQAAGKVGEMTTTGSGTVVVLATSPVLTMPLLLNGTTLTWASSTQLSALANGKLTITNNAATAGGVIDVATDSTFKFFGRDGSTAAILQAGTLALGGATIGSNALAVTGTAAVSGALSLGTTLTNTAATNFNLASASGGFVFNTGGGSIFRWDQVSGAQGLLNLGSTSQIGWSSVTTPAATADTYLTRNAAANLQLGAAAVDTAPVAQTLSVQNVLAGGTSNVAGANFTIAGSQGKGTGVGGSIIFQTAPAGSTGTAVNALATALTIAGTGVVSVGPLTITTNNSIGFGTSNTDGTIGASSGAFLFRASGSVGATINVATDGTVKLFGRDGTTAAPVTAATASLSTDRSLILTNQTSSAGAQVGTLTNAPAAGNPTFWVKTTINGVSIAIPGWPG